MTTTTSTTTEKADKADKGEKLPPLERKIAAQERRKAAAQRRLERATATRAKLTEGIQAKIDKADEQRASAEAAIRKADAHIAWLRSAPADEVEAAPEDGDTVPLALDGDEGDA
jgi:hypothetical protein